MAGLAFPTWAYQTVTPFGSQIVASQAALNLLGPTWGLIPIAVPPPANIPFDPGFPNTDTRLQQLLIESRIANQYLYQANGSQGDDPQALRADVLATDSVTTS